MEETFDYKRYPNKLNLGCGFDILDGYLNVDLKEFHHPDLISDVSNLKLLPSNYYVEIIANDILEHIERTKTTAVLAEWNRLLVPHGLIKIRVPNIIGLMSLFTKKDFQTIKKQEELIQCCFGTQAYTGDFHYTSFTELLIRHYLEISGFEKISIYRRDEWLFEITAEKKAGVDHVVDERNEDYGEFIYNAYLSILNRKPDDEGYNYYLNQLITGKMDRECFLNNISNSEEKKKLLEQCEGK